MAFAGTYPGPRVWADLLTGIGLFIYRRSSRQRPTSHTNPLPQTWTKFKRGAERACTTRREGGNFVSARYEIAFPKTASGANRGPFFCLHPAFFAGCDRNLFQLRPPFAEKLAN
jgi:hypothetical protein